MPELPEVETVRRGLAPAITGRTISAVAVGTPTYGRLLRDPPALVLGLTGERIESVDRHGKFLLLPLSSGQVFVGHLGMSGQVQVVPAGRGPLPAVAHSHLELALDDGAFVRVIDPRQFGQWYVTSGDVPELRGLGPDALTVTRAALVARLAGRRAPIKAMLMDQRIVAGVGNIYADEALWQARVRPDRPAGALGRVSSDRLASAIPALLAAAIERRGTSFDMAYRDVNGNAGSNQGFLAVYGRAGEPCRRCGRPLDGSRIAGRSAVWCRRCQR